MKVANVSTTKNQLSRILAEVQKGESYLIVDRNVPIARIEPLEAPEGRLARLQGDGLVSVPADRLDVERFLSRPKANVAEPASALSALLDERESSR